MDTYVGINWVGLWLAGSLILISLGISRWLRLGLEGRMLLGAVRTIVQLVIVGYILGWILLTESPWLTLAAVTVQFSFAVWTAASLMQKRLANIRLVTFAALLPSYLVVLGILAAFVLTNQPWWDPRFILPLGGMLLGNSLTGIALAVNRYRSEVAANRDLILARLAVAATWQQSVEEERRNAANAALLPVVSSLLTVGVVALPGMLTGQVIAGADPVDAAKYQIVVMFMIASATAISVAVALVLVSGRQYFEADVKQT